MRARALFAWIVLAAAPLLAREGEIMIRKVAPSSSLVAITAEKASLRGLLASLALHLPERVVVELDGDRVVTYKARSVQPDSALAAIASRAGLVADRRDRSWVVLDPKELAVTIDVKDEPIANILRSVQKQCGIRNLMIDPDVQGSGTFLFREVRCGVALATIFRSMGLTAESYPSSVLRVF